MASIFSKIVVGEIPCHKIAETDHCLAFLNVMPLVEGHTLVIPKREENYLFDLSDEEISELMVFGKRVAAAVKKAIPCKRIGVAVIGLEVPHAHVHLVPMNRIADINFTHEKLKPSNAELATTAEKIRKFI